jgi:hypothetical protein
MLVKASRCRFRLRVALVTAIVLTAATGPAALSPAPAIAFNPLKPACKVAQLGSGAVGKLCAAAAAPGKLLKAGGKLLTGHFGSALHAIFGGGGGASAAGTAAGLAAVGVWVLGGARFALHETATVLGRTTSPQLEATWFSSSYWRMGAIAALITLPFLFAAAVQALIRSDIALLARAAFGYLPLAMLGVGIAAPLTMLLLAASDQLSAIVGAAAGHESTHFLVRAGAVVGVLSVFKGSPFLAFLVGLIAAAGALVLWLELLMREAAVYIVVLMLPLAFAAMVWPARRIWAVRMVEVLVALILAKFAIVAVLALGGAALGHGGSGITGALAGAVLVLLGAFAPWALLRLLPLTELASAAAGSLRDHARTPIGLSAEDPGALTGPAVGWAGALTAGMRQAADELRVDRHDPGNAQAESERLDQLGRVPAAVRAEELGRSATQTSSVLDDGNGRRPAASDRTSESQGASPVAGIHIDPIAGPAVSGERSPGMGPMWQAPDLSWRPFEIEGEWPPPPLWPWPEEEGAESEPTRERRHDSRAGTGGGHENVSGAHENVSGAPAGRAGATDRGAGEVHDPLPPPQETDEGPL